MLPHKLQIVSEFVCHEKATVLIVGKHTGSSHCSVITIFSLPETRGTQEVQTIQQCKPLALLSRGQAILTSREDSVSPALVTCPHLVERL
jgi:hypothetical protein